MYIHIHHILLYTYIHIYIHTYIIFITYLTYLTNLAYLAYLHHIHTRHTYHTIQLDIHTSHTAISIPYHTDRQTDRQIYIYIHTNIHTCRASTFQLSYLCCFEVVFVCAWFENCSLMSSEPSLESMQVDTGLQLVTKLLTDAVAELKSLRSLVEANTKSIEKLSEEVKNGVQEHPSKNSVLLATDAVKTTVTKPIVVGTKKRARDGQLLTGQPKPTPDYRRNNTMYGSTF